MPRALVDVMSPVDVTVTASSPSARMPISVAVMSPVELTPTASLVERALMPSEPAPVAVMANGPPVPSVVSELMVTAPLLVKLTPSTPAAGAMSWVTPFTLRIV